VLEQQIFYKLIERKGSVLTNLELTLPKAPKTAIIGTLDNEFPETTGKMLWLAVYNLSSLNEERCKVLKGRKVFLLPDLSKDGLA
jgi:hypothetical protein